MNKFHLSDFTLAIELLLRKPEFRSVTVFQGPLKDVAQRVRVTRRGSQVANSREHEMVVTYGRPNYQEREFLKECREAKCLPRKWKTWK